MADFRVINAQMDPNWFLRETHDYADDRLWVIPGEIHTVSSDFTERYGFAQGEQIVDGGRLEEVRLHRLGWVATEGGRIQRFQIHGSSIVPDGTPAKPRIIHYGHEERSGFSIIKSEYIYQSTAVVSTGLQEEVDALPTR